jgi:hypothetical protein
MSDVRLKECFALLEAAAAAGERCPMNFDRRIGGNQAVQAGLVRMLARLGRIRVEISGRNFRTVTILEGPHAGKHTQRDQNRWVVWKVIDKNGARTIAAPQSPRRQQPSAPRLLPGAQS